MIDGVMILPVLLLLALPPRSVQGECRGGGAAAAAAGAVFASPFGVASEDICCQFTYKVCSMYGWHRS